MDKVNEDTSALEASKVTEAEPRECLIETAVKFLQNPKVRHSPFDQRKAFLERKGLTPDEIRIAIERSGTAGDVNAPVVSVSTSQQQPVYSQLAPPQQVSKWSRSRDTLAAAIVVGGIGYALYILYKKYVYPVWFGPSKDEKQLEALTQGMAQLQDTVAQTLAQIRDTQQLLSRQQTSLEEIMQKTLKDSKSGFKDGDMMLTDIKDEVKSLKALLLGSRRFPAPPVNAPVLPSWQLAASQPEATTSNTVQSSATDEKPVSSDISTEEENGAEIQVMAEEPKELEASAESDVNSSQQDTEGVLEAKDSNTVDDLNTEFTPDTTESNAVESPSLVQATA